MKLLKSIAIFQRSSKFRNYSIVLGMILGFFLISSLRTGEVSFTNIPDETMVKSEFSAADAIANESTEQSTKYHNFLASYFLQESTVKRTARKKEERESVFTNFKDVHNIIVSRMWSIF